MKYRFHPETETELNEAVDYYDASQDGLGSSQGKSMLQ